MRYGVHFGMIGGGTSFLVQKSRDRRKEISLCGIMDREAKAERQPPTLRIAMLASSTNQSTDYSYLSGYLEIGWAGDSSFLSRIGSLASRRG